MNPQDPAGRDTQFHVSGSWYASVYGQCSQWHDCCDKFPCTLAQLEDCGPCAWVPNTAYNITLNITELPAEACIVTNFPKEADNTIQLPSGVAYMVPKNEGLECDHLQYYKVQISDPCYDLQIEVYGFSGNDLQQIAAAYVGRWPALRPALSYTKEGTG